MDYSPVVMQQQAWSEVMAYQEYKDEHDLAEWAEYVYRERNDALCDAMESLEELEADRFLTSPSREREDLELAARLREVANLLEKKWL